MGVRPTIHYKRILGCISGRKRFAVYSSSFALSPPILVSQKKSQNGTILTRPIKWWSFLRSTFFVLWLWGSYIWEVIVSRDATRIRITLQYITLHCFSEPYIVLYEGLMSHGHTAPPSLDFLYYTNHKTSLESWLLHIRSVLACLRTTQPSSHCHG